MQLLASTRINKAIYQNQTDFMRLETAGRTDEIPKMPMSPGVAVMEPSGQRKRHRLVLS